MRTHLVEEQNMRGISPLLYSIVIIASDTHVCILVYVYI